MLRIILSATLATFLSAASAQPGKVKTDPMAEPDAGQQSAEAQMVLHLQQFANNLQEAGFTDIQAVPGAVVLQAKDRSGKLVTMLFDAQTATATLLNQTPDAETTGSGNSDDNQLGPDDPQ